MDRRGAPTPEGALTLEGAFLRDICERPEDDAVRLIYADHLEEVAGAVPCPVCSEYVADPANPFHAPGYHPERDPASGRHEGGWTNCKTCNSGGKTYIGAPGFVSDGRRERAEFIRVQVEIAATQCTCGHDAPNGLCRRCCVLRRRERELLTCHGNAWVPKVLRHAEYRWLGATYQKRVLADGAHTVQEIVTAPGCTFARGFVDSVTLSTAAFLGGPCAACGGNRATLYCSACEGTGKTPGVLAALFSASPITKITLSDKRPGQTALPPLRPWRWVKGDGAAEALPAELFALLPGVSERDNAYYSDSEAAALEAASLACVNYGRECAKVLEK